MTFPGDLLKTVAPAGSAEVAESIHETAQPVVIIAIPSRFPPAAKYSGIAEHTPADEACCQQGMRILIALIDACPGEHVDVYRWQCRSKTAWRCMACFPQRRGFKNRRFTAALGKWPASEIFHAGQQQAPLSVGSNSSRINGSRSDTANALHRLPITADSSRQ